MKKILIVLISIILLTGCTIKKEEKKEETTPEIKNFTKDIELSSNSETNYTWEYSLEVIDSEEDPTEYLSLTKEHKIKCANVTDSNCPEVDIFNLRGLKTGNIKVTFKYTYNSKKKKHSTKTAIYNIEIDEELNVLEISHEGDYFNK